MAISYDEFQIVTVFSLALTERVAADRHAIVEKVTKKIVEGDFGHKVETSLVLLRTLILMSIFLIFQLVDMVRFKGCLLDLWRFMVFLFFLRVEQV